MEEKNYKVKKVKTSEEVNKELNARITANIIFAVAGLALGTAAFGGEFGNHTAQIISAAASVGIGSRSIGGLVQNLKLKSTLKKQQEDKSKTM